MNRLLMMRCRFEDAEVLEVGVERERDLRAHVGDHQLSHDESKVFDGPGAARAAVANETRRPLVPLVVEVVDRVLQRARRGMVVLGRHEDERVEGCDLGRPCLRVIVRVLAEDRRDRLVEQREIVILDVDELELGVAARARDLVDPASRRRVTRRRTGPRPFALCLVFRRNLVVGEPIGEDAESNFNEVD